MKRSSVLVGFCLLVLGAYVLASPPSGYHLLKKMPFGAAPGDSEYFDYITFDNATRRVYLSHGTEVKIVNADNGSVVGTVSDLKRCHGVVVVNDLGRGFITDGETGQVVIFDLKTFKTLGQIKAGRNPDSILYDPASKRLFVFNGGSKDSTVIDPAKGTVVTTLPLGGGPEQAVADGKGMVYNDLADTNDVLAIDSNKLMIKSRWKVAPEWQPTPSSMDRQHRRLFIGGRNPKMFVMMDADTGKVIGQGFPIGDRVDANIFDPENGMIAAATREGTIHIFHEDSPEKISVIETVKSEFGAKTMALDPKTHNLYVDTSDFGAPQQPNGQPVAVPGTFRLLIYGPQAAT